MCKHRHFPGPCPLCRAPVRLRWKNFYAYHRVAYKNKIDAGVWVQTSFIGLEDLSMSAKSPDPVLLRISEVQYHWGILSQALASDCLSHMRVAILLFACKSIAKNSSLWFLHVWLLWELAWAFNHTLPTISFDYKTLRGLCLVWNKTLLPIIRIRVASSTFLWFFLLSA